MDEREGEAEREVETTQWTTDRIASLKCVRREGGKKSHVFLDHSNVCECGEKNLNAYRDLVLR